MDILNNSPFFWGFFEHQRSFLRAQLQTHVEHPSFFSFRVRLEASYPANYKYFINSRVAELYDKLKGANLRF